MEGQEEVIHVDSDLVCCAQCKQLLPDADEIAADDSNASVCCDCPCKCESWHCWQCAQYTQEMADEDIEWVCTICVKNCDGICSNV